jgi:hypothetical protein
VQLERREGVGQVLDRADGLAGLRVVQDEVALGERPRSTSWPVRRIGVPS